MDTARQKAILVDLIHPRMLARHSAERMGELEELVRTYGGLVVVRRHQKRFAPHPRTFIGPGKAAALAEEGKALGARVLVVNDALKPRQTYALSEILRPAGVEVWDRIDLILRIFSRHASTTEARLEIELASIRHMGPRIFGMGMELLRQGGGIGTRGIGETNTEIMKRHLRERERRVRKRLDACKRVRSGHRQSRRRQGLRTFALVGYTNAGKTTLLNRLTKRQEHAADALFATLDTRVGKLYLPQARVGVLVSDTIGFIKHLPPELLNAFSSTLSEAVDADALLHVVDASDKNALQHVAVVEDILDRLGLMERPRILVLNKCDRAEGDALDALERRDDELPCVRVSAANGEGMEEVVDEIRRKVKGEW